jgi:hypothetical protein
MGGVMTLREVLSQQLSGGTEKKHDNVGHESCCPGQNIFFYLTPFFILVLLPITI